MSVYHKEKASNLTDCFESLLNQSICASEWVIVKDGPLTEELEVILNYYDSKYQGLIRFVSLPVNKGLGLALREGVKNCSFELVARMDTDDIAMSNRFEKQLLQFMKYKDLDICGSHIKEFEDSLENIVSVRKVPLKMRDIYNYQKRRSAFNHMTVMFRKSMVLESGNYEHAPLMEDDVLWSKMFLNKCKAKNIDEYLVYARVGVVMIDRRGGWEYFKKYKNSRKKILKIGFCSYWDYLITISIQLFVSLLPTKTRRLIFYKLLREIK